MVHWLNVGRYGVLQNMSLRIVLILVVASLGGAIGAYYLLSPYEKCVRKQMDRFSGGRVTAMDPDIELVAQMICSKATKW